MIASMLSLSGILSTPVIMSAACFRLMRSAAMCRRISG